MADDTYSRGYRNDRQDRGGAGDSGAPDPLTELARLIGQSDPFATDRPRATAPHRGEAQPQPADWRAGGPQYPQAYDTGADDERYGAAREPGHYADGAPAEGYAGYQNGYAYSQGAPAEAGYDETAGYGKQDPYQRDQQAYSQGEPQAYQRDPQGYEEDQDFPPSDLPFFSQSERGPHGEEGGEEGPYENTRSVPGYGAPPFFGDPNERPDEYYEDAPAPRRGWMVTAAALVGLAVVGTAGAFAYRAVFSGSETRMITRDVGPSKITPVQTSQDGTNRQGDRVASVGANERMGPPPEQPIAIPEPPRTTPPVLTQSPPPMAPPPVLSAPAAAPPVLDTASNGPTRIVRTERIKPADPADVTATRSPAQTRAATPPAAPPARVAAQAPIASNAPLSLAPQGASNAAVPPPAPPSHTTAVASIAPATERAGGGYYAQVGAMKSEDEARSSFQNVQSRHGNLLGGHQLVIRRKDLGSKGVWYGAQVGPFSREAANKLCEDLKAAGQTCMLDKH